MAKYKIPIVYLSVMEIEVEAFNLKLAIKKAVSNFFKIPDENYEFILGIDKSMLEERHGDEVETIEENKFYDFKFQENSNF